jgi:hypothetical protein
MTEARQQYEYSELTEEEVTVILTEITRMLKPVVFMSRFAVKLNDLPKVITIYKEREYGDSYHAMLHYDSFTVNVYLNRKFEIESVSIDYHNTCG